MYYICYIGIIEIHISTKSDSKVQYYSYENWFSLGYIWRQFWKIWYQYRHMQHGAYIQVGFRVKTSSEMFSKNIYFSI
jgi:hypothetical protein